MKAVRVAGSLRRRQQPPRPSTSQLPCPACRTVSVSAVPLPTSAGTSQQQQPASSWAQSLSRAGQSLFQKSSVKDAVQPAADGREQARAVVLSPAVQQLTNEVELARPDPSTVWALFTDIELRGETHTIPARTFRFIIPALHSRPSHLDPDISASLARTYTAKVDLVRLRWQQAGHPDPDPWTTLGAMSLQYKVLGYAPGACQVWEEAMEQQGRVSNSIVGLSFAAMIKWIDIHGKLGGPELAQLAAEPLVDQVVAMLSDLSVNSLRDQELTRFFSIIVKARAHRMFVDSMRVVYGFEAKHPGVPVISDKGRYPLSAKKRDFEEEQLWWVLDMLAAKDDLSSMIAVYETMADPSAASSSDTSYFSSNALASDSTATPSPISKPPFSPDLDSSPRTLVLLAETAARLGKPELVRHYLDTLYFKWSVGLDSYLSSLESALGIHYEKPVLTPAQQSAHDIAAKSSSKEAPSSSSTTKASSSPSVDSTPEPADSSSPAPATLPLSITTTTLPTPIQLHATPLYILVDFAKKQSSLPLQRIYRRRVKQTVKELEEASGRLATCVASLEALPPTRESVSLVSRVQRERTLTQQSLADMRELLPVVKSETNALAAYRHKKKVLQEKRKREKLAEKAVRDGDRSVVLKRKIIVGKVVRRVNAVEKEALTMRYERLKATHRLQSDGKEFYQWSSDLQRFKKKLSDSYLAAQAKAEAASAAAAAAAEATTAGSTTAV
ncbi:hypothetical protein MNV49_002448 [Pseudohyphozyma bogoriensis]|nr:hypothetical protein MNV49_002448 [Pseudohyphozyma bogoriensis]